MSSSECLGSSRSIDSSLTIVAAVAGLGDKRTESGRNSFDNSRYLNFSQRFQDSELRQKAKLTELEAE